MFIFSLTFCTFGGDVVEDYNKDEATHIVRNDSDVRNLGDVLYLNVVNNGLTILSSWYDESSVNQWWLGNIEENQ